MSKINTNIYKNQFYRLKDYIEEFYNIRIDQAKNQDDEWDPNEGVIRLNKNLKYRERLFSLIHELGHVIIDSETKIYGTMCFSKNYPKSVRSKKQFIHVINEEVIAWNKGKEAITFLNFKYNENQLDEYMSKCLMSYVKENLINIYGEKINIDNIKTNI